MKKIIILTSLLLLCAFTNLTAGSFGSGFGSLSTATTQGMGVGYLGFGAGFADASSVFGSFNYGMSANTDGRIRLGLVDAKGSDAKLAFAADFKYNFISVGELNNGPFDMALGGLFEFYSLDASSVMLIGAQYIGSYPIKMSNNSMLTPYGRFDARLEAQSFDNANVESKSNLEFGFNAGVKWELSNTINLFGEFQFSGNDGLIIGIDFNVM